MSFSFQRALLTNRTFAFFLVCCFLFHLANAAMLPELGEMLARGNPKLSAPFMSACIIVTQLVIAGSASWIGKTAAVRRRKPLRSSVSAFFLFAEFSTSSPTPPGR